MNKDIGRSLFFIILALIFIGGIGIGIYPKLMGAYIPIVIISIPLLILIAISELLTSKTTSLGSPKSNPLERKKLILTIIIVMIVYTIFYSIIK